MEAGQADPTGARVLVQVVQVGEGRQIGVADRVAEELQTRAGDIADAVRVGAETVAGSLEGLPSRERWRLGEVTAKFGVTLQAQAGAILAQASAAATFEVTLKFQHTEGTGSH